MICSQLLVLDCGICGILIKEYDLSLINVVYANDEWGSSVAEALVSYAGDGFHIKVLRSFELAEDVEGIKVSWMVSKFLLLLVLLL